MACPRCEDGELIPKTSEDETMEPDEFTRFVLAEDSVMNIRASCDSCYYSDTRTITVRSR